MRTKVITITALLIYWICFWVLFFQNAVPVISEQRYETIGPLFEVFGRGFGDNLVDARTAWMMSNVWLNIPCWLITWPLTKLGIEGRVLGTNVLGARLLLITALSCVQWYFVVVWLQRFVLARSRGMRGARPYDAT